MWRLATQTKVGFIVWVLLWQTLSTAAFATLFFFLSLYYSLAYTIQSFAFSQLLPQLLHLRLHFVISANNQLLVRPIVWSDFMLMLWVIGIWLKYRLNISLVFEQIPQDNGLCSPKVTLNVEELTGFTCNKKIAKLLHQQQRLLASMFMC